MPGIVFVGLQWGGEGKDKVIDLFSRSPSHIVWFQKGCDSDRAIVDRQVERTPHQIPRGCLLDPESLVWEIQEIKSRSSDVERQLQKILIRNNTVLFKENCDTLVGNVMQSYSRVAAPSIPTASVSTDLVQEAFDTFARDESLQAAIELDNLEELNDYCRDEQEIDKLSSPLEDLTCLELICEILLGWQKLASGVDKAHTPSRRAWTVIDAIEQLFTVPIGMICIGSRRDQTIPIDEEGV